MLHRETTHSRQMLVREGDRLHEDVERGRAGRREHARKHALDLVHPAVGVVAGWDAVGEQGSGAGLLDHAGGEAIGQLQRTQLGVDREAVSAFALECRGAVPEHLHRKPAGLVEHGVVTGVCERPSGGGDPSARPGDLLVGDPGDLALVLLRTPAGEGKMRVAVDEAGHQRAARSVDLEALATVVIEAGHAAVLDHHRPARERELGGTVVAQVGQAVGRGTQDLRSVAHAEVPGVHRQRVDQAAPSASSSIGTRTPSRRAASIASG